ncbi:MAG: hypothetical protein JRJ43_10170 [Deltaproteobacteria bacterium]|nr:hypothetical protein [Deltaproteobacteria bacterium]
MMVAKVQGRHREVVSLSADRQVKEAEHFTSWFIEKLKGYGKEKGIKTKMRVKLAAELLIIAWTLMKKKEPFNPELLKIKE